MAAIAHKYSALHNITPNQMILFKARAIQQWANNHITRWPDLQKPTGLGDPTAKAYTNEIMY